MTAEPSNTAAEDRQTNPAGRINPAGRTNPAGLIYGVLAVATVIAAEGTRRETFPRLLAASAVIMVLYWVAHAYSHHWGSRLSATDDWTVGDVLSALVQETPILVGAVVPGLALLGAWLAGASIEDGVTAVLWCAGTEVVLLEVVAGLRSRLRPGQLVVQSAVGIAMGLAILAVRVLLH